MRAAPLGQLQSSGFNSPQKATNQAKLVKLLRGKLMAGILEVLNGGGDTYGFTLIF